MKGFPVIYDPCIGTCDLLEVDSCFHINELLPTSFHFDEMRKSLLCPSDLSIALSIRLVHRLALSTKWLEVSSSRWLTEYKELFVEDALSSFSFYEKERVKWREIHFDLPNTLLLCRLIELREDYKKAKIANIVKGMNGWRTIPFSKAALNINSPFPTVGPSQTSSLLVKQHV